MAIKDLNEVVDAKKLVPNIASEKTRQITKKYRMLCRGSVRIATGRFSTQEEVEARKLRVKELP